MPQGFRVGMILMAVGENQHIGLHGQIAPVDGLPPPVAGIALRHAVGQIGIDHDGYAAGFQQQSCLAQKSALHAFLLLYAPFSLTDYRLYAILISQEAFSDLLAESKAIIAFVDADCCCQYPVFYRFSAF